MSQGDTQNKELCNYPEALEYYEKSLAIKEEIDDKRGEGAPLNNIGIIYEDLSDYLKALEYYEKSLSIKREFGDKAGEGITLINIGIIYEDLSDYTKAFEYYEKALSIKREIGDKDGEGIALINIGCLYEDLSNYPKALEYNEKALPILNKVGDKENEGICLYNIGKIHVKLSHYSVALTFLDEALSVYEKISDDEGKSETLGQIGNTRLNLKDYSRALSYYEKAIAIIESIRSGLKNEQLKTGFFQKRAEMYSNIVHCLFELHRINSDKGFDLLSFTYAEKSKARSLLDLLAEAKADIKQGVDPELRTKEQELEREYSRVNTNLQEALSVPDKELDQDNISQLNNQLVSIEDQLEELKQTITSRNPHYAELKYPEPVVANEVREKLIDAETMLLEYKVTEDAVFVWSITKENYRFLKIQISAEELNEKTEAFRNTISDRLPADVYVARSRELYRMLLEPVLKEKKKKLLIIPDGVLSYLPFETLLAEDVNPGRTGIDFKTLPYLTKEYVITYGPSASVASLKAKEKAQATAPEKLLAFGDPLFKNEEALNENIYVRSSTPETDRSKLTRLLYSGEEVKNIGSLFHQSDIYVQENAREEELEPPRRLDCYRYIHFATHCILNETNPQLSGIVLAQDDDPQEDGFLQTREIFNLVIKADLVVLSACDTGLGKMVDGEGIIGLTRAWMYAGASSVLISLWNVNDRSTSIFMTEFYKNLQKGIDAGTALRNARLLLMEKTVRDSAGNEVSFAHPFYWAPFVLMGNTR